LLQIVDTKGRTGVAKSSVISVVELVVGGVLQSASAGPTSTSMIAPIDAENTIRCNIISNHPFKTSNPRSAKTRKPSGVTMRKLSVNWVAELMLIAIVVQSLCLDSFSLIIQFSRSWFFKRANTLGLKPKRRGVAALKSTPRYSRPPRDSKHTILRHVVGCSLLKATRIGSLAHQLLSSQSHRPIDGNYNTLC
jgi:hypothetical protein